MAGLVAMSPDGHVVATGAGRRVWVARHEAGTDPVDIVDVGGEVVGLASSHGGFAVLTDAGQVVGIDDHARIRWDVAVGPGLAIGGDGPHAAVLSGAGFVRVGPDGARPGAEVAGGRVLAVGPDGAVAVGTSDGRVVAFSPTGARLGAGDLGEPDGVRGLARSTSPAGPFWFATAGERVFAVNADASRVDVVTRTANRAPDQIVASRDGRVIVVRLGVDLVIALAMPGRETLAQIRLFDRSVTGVALGGPLWLGLGLDLGDNNWISLEDGAVWRSDPPPTEPRRRWSVSASVSNGAVVKRRDAAPALGIVGGGSTASLAEDSVDGNNRPATEEAPRPTPQSGDTQDDEGWWARWTGWLGKR